MIIFGAFGYARLSNAAKPKVMKALAVAVLGLEAARTVWAVSVGHYPLDRMLPLHLCGVMVFIEFFAVFTGKRFLKEFGYCSGLPGALMALVTPEPSGYPLVSFQHLQSLLVHALLVLIPVLWMAGDGFRPDIRNLPKCFTLLLGLTGVNAVVNTVLHSNYMFICRAPEKTPLAVFDAWVGHPWYVGLVLVCIVIVWTLMYAPWIIANTMKTSTPNGAASVRGE